MNNGILWLVVGLGVLMFLGRDIPYKKPYNPALPGQSGGITVGTGEVLYEGSEY